MLNTLIVVVSAICCVELLTEIPTRALKNLRIYWRRRRGRQLAKRHIYTGARARITIDVPGKGRVKLKPFSDEDINYPRVVRY